MVGPSGESSVEKSAIKTEGMLQLTFSLGDCDLGAAKASSRQKLLLFFSSPKSPHRPLVSAILLSGARAVIGKQGVIEVIHGILNQHNEQARAALKYPSKKPTRQDGRKPEAPQPEEQEHTQDETSTPRQQGSWPRLCAVFVRGQN